MFRKWVGAVLVVAIASIFATVSVAAPIAGSFAIDIVIAPSCANLIASNQSICDKLDDTLVKVEADLLLTLSFSGLDLTSATVFTFKGVESQSFTVSGTIGAMTFKDIFVFASDLVEIEFVRSISTLSTRYCINLATPGDLTPPFFDCPTADAVLFFLLEDVGIFHPAVANLILGSAFDALGMLDAPLELAKKIVDVSINIVGLTVTMRTLFANFTTGQALSQTRSWQTGVVLALEGQTVSGITMRSETWLGARQGLECWGECKPIERNYGGKVVSSFTAQEEKIFIRNLVFAGIANNFRVEFKFGQPNPTDNGLSYMEWNQVYRFIGLSISNTLRIDKSLDPHFDFVIASFKYGEMSVAAIFYIYPDFTNTWQTQLAELIATFDPAGATVTSDLTLCTESLFSISCTAGVLQHDISVSATVGDLTFEATLKLLGMLTGFSELWANVTWKVGNVSFKTSLVIATNSVEALAFGVNLRF